MNFKCINYNTFSKVFVLEYFLLQILKSIDCKVSVFVFQSQIMDLSNQLTLVQAQSSYLRNGALDFTQKTLSTKIIPSSKALPLFQNVDKGLRMSGAHFSIHPNDMFQKAVGVGRSLDRDGCLNIHLFVEIANQIKKIIDKESFQSFQSKVSSAINSLWKNWEQNPTNSMNYEIVQNLTFFLLWVAQFGLQYYFHQQRRIGNSNSIQTREEGSNRTWQELENETRRAEATAPPNQRLTTQRRN